MRSAGPTWWSVARPREGPASGGERVSGGPPQPWPGHPLPVAPGALWWPHAAGTGVVTARGAAGCHTPRIRTSVPCASPHLTPAPCGNASDLGKISPDEVFLCFLLGGRAVAARAHLSVAQRRARYAARNAASASALLAGAAASPCLPPFVFNGPSSKFHSVGRAGCVCKSYPC